MRRVRSPGEKKEHSSTYKRASLCIEHQAPSLLNTPVETTSVLTVVGTEWKINQFELERPCVFSVCGTCKVLQNCIRWGAEEQDDVGTAIGDINMVLEIETSRVIHPCCQSVQHHGKSEDHMIPPRPQGWCDLETQNKGGGLWYL